MNYELHRLILETVKGLRNQKSWTGRTHVVKTLFLAAQKADLPFEFVLYKHGPYSFEVDEELESMLSYDAVEKDAIGGYGPQLRVGEGAVFVEDQVVSASALDAIRKATQYVSSRNVSELEALATTVWLMTPGQPNERAELVSGLIKLKPHISQPIANKAYDEALAWMNS
jgi:uncharacterized protein YwgA